MRKELEHIETRLFPLRNHPLYTHLNGIEDVQTFMEMHVYAVWDFMSLLKALQNELTCTQVPWVHKAEPILARFINEIVHGEESDINELGEPKSHFEMYIDAMEEVQADTLPIQTFIAQIRKGKNVYEAINKLNVDASVKEFLEFTFQTIDSNKAHWIASVFTFGREDVIPDMFFSIIQESAKNNIHYPKLRYYLQRHIDVDGDEHGPLSLKMIEALCGENPQLWDDVLEYGQRALEFRVKLWDGILAQIQTKKLVLS
jgi:hypothetical protein